MPAVVIVSNLYSFFDVFTKSAFLLSPKAMIGMMFFDATRSIDFRPDGPLSVAKNLGLTSLSSKVLLNVSRNTTLSFSFAGYASTETGIGTYPPQSTITDNTTPNPFFLPPWLYQPPKSAVLFLDACFLSCFIHASTNTPSHNQTTSFSRPRARNSEVKSSENARSR